MAASPQRFRTWWLVHKWTSLITTAFLLLLCLTGLPLIFYHEIDELTRPMKTAAVVHATPHAPLAGVMSDAAIRTPGTRPLYLSWEDEGRSPVVYALLGKALDSDGGDLRSLPYDERTGQRIDAPPADEGVMAFLLDLHANLLLGLPGQLLLGVIGLVFVAAVVSGVVVYAPFMRKLAFATVRRDSSRRTRWLDTHNLVGIVTTGWVGIVALTGFILAMETPITLIWQHDQLAGLTAAYRDQPAVDSPITVDRAISTARAAAPDSRLGFVAWPGTPYSSRHHYMITLKGNTPLTERLVRVALIDAQTGHLTALRDTPWYVTAAYLSAPLHFGDYGLWPLKVLWAVLDLAAILVLISGLVLWLRRPEPRTELVT
jgi:uncharacterized iron-regulated membrane protein